MKQNRHHHLFRNSNLFIIQYTLLKEQLTMPPQIDNSLFSEAFEAEAVAKKLQEVKTSIENQSKEIQTQSKRLAVVENDLKEVKTSIENQSKEIQTQSRLGLVIILLLLAILFKSKVINRLYHSMFKIYKLDIHITPTCTLNWNPTVNSVRYGGSYGFAMFSLFVKNECVHFTRQNGFCPKRWGRFNKFASVRNHFSLQWIVLESWGSFETTWQTCAVLLYQWSR